MTKVDIVSGFLGAGKTTLIKKLIQDGWNGEQLVLIENEFGEIGIDGGFLKDSGIEITQMNSGCICCSLVGDFGTALKEVVEKYSPDRIIIEPSGVGKLSDVIKAVEKVEEDVDIVVNNFVAVVDAGKCKMYMKNFGEFFNNQIENAKTIILSRTQNVKEDKLAATVKMIKEHNDKATLVTTPWDEITGSKILEAMEEENSMAEELLENAKVCPTCGHVHDHDHDHEHHHHDHDEECCCHDHDHEHEHHHHDHDEECCCHDHEHEHHHHDHDGECCHHDHDHEHHHHHADDVFTSWGKETPHKFNKADLEATLDKLANTEEFGVVLRAKGIVPCEDGTWLHYDLTPGEYEVRTGSADYTGRICVIGTKLAEEKLKALFHIAE